MNEHIKVLKEELKSKKLWNCYTGVEALQAAINLMERYERGEMVKVVRYGSGKSAEEMIDDYLKKEFSEGESK